MMGNLNRTKIIMDPREFLLESGFPSELCSDRRVPETTKNSKKKIKIKTRSVTCSNKLEMKRDFFQDEREIS